MNRARYVISLLVAGAFLLSPAVQAGGLDAPAAPTAPGSAMFTIADLYNRLASGTAGAKRSGGFAEPGAAPVGGTMPTLDEIMGKAPAADNTNGAGAGDVLSGKTFWGLQSGLWGPRVGTMPNRGAVTVTPGAAAQAIPAGYHNGSGQVGGDASLVGANIKAGATIFGVAGDNNVVNTSSGNATAGEILPGRKAWVGGAEITGAMPAVTTDVAPGSTTKTIPTGWYNGLASVTGDANLVTANIKAGTTIFGVTGSGTVVDTSPANATAGEILLDRKAYTNGAQVTGMRAGGVSLSGGSFSSGRRWYKPNDGTVVDCKTGLVWLSNPVPTTRPFIATQGPQLDCMRYLYSMSPATVSGLDDDSKPGDWGMPTLREMMSLFEPPEAIGSAGAQLFDNTNYNAYYWTSTPMPVGPGVSSPDKVYVINMAHGAYLAEDKLGFETINHYVWPIRRRNPW